MAHLSRKELQQPDFAFPTFRSEWEKASAKPSIVESSSSFQPLLGLPASAHGFSLYRLHALAFEVLKTFPLTLANKITLIRILLIPVFVGFGLYYTHSVAEGAPDERLRWAAIGVFTLAAVSDALDGWVARHFNQRSKLGVILDPLADKLLMLSAVCVLSFSPWPNGLPLYFVILSISREILTIAGAFVIRFVVGKVDIAPHWTGKASTFTQIVAIGFAMLSLGRWVPWSAAVASVFVVGSGAIYLIDAVRQITAAGHGNAES